MKDWPTTLEINAWLGDRPARSDVAPTARKLATDPARRVTGSKGKLAPKELDPANWSDTRIGWGLILHQDAAIPAPLEELLAARSGSPLLRFKPGVMTHLHNPAGPVDIPIVAGPTGTATPASLPYYLLIYGSPDLIPWELQHVLNQEFFVGRLDLEGQALKHYVRALIDEWSDSAAEIEQAVTWSVVQDKSGITSLMRKAVGERVVTAWRSDGNQTFRNNIVFLDGAAAAATNAGLVETLTARRPALIVTTSHGRTGPLDNPAAMRAGLGLLVDQAGGDLDPATLLAAWQPDGAVWYSHACCSAGCSSASQFDDQFSQLVPPGSDVDRVLKGVAALGSLTAPFPRALLGAPKPLRAFIGHVEPTFDLSLRDIGTGQHLTGMLRSALYEQIYLHKPVGLAFSSWLRSGAAFAGPFEAALKKFNKNSPGARKLLLAYQLLSRDRRNTMILGDPTVALPQMP